MAIKTEIRKNYPMTNVVVHSSEDIYMMDMRNHSITKGIEIDDTPIVLMPGGEAVKGFHISNPNILSVDFAIFQDNQFRNALNKDKKHCEGCFYPTFDAPKSWISFIEIKDCKPSKLGEYKNEAKEQIINAVDDFREKGIVTTQKVYGIISVPRRIIHDSTMMIDIVEINKLLSQHKIHFAVTNDVQIESDLVFVL